MSAEPGGVQLNTQLQKDNSGTTKAGQRENPRDNQEGGHNQPGNIRSRKRKRKRNRNRTIQKQDLPDEPGPSTSARDVSPQPGPSTATTTERSPGLTKNELSMILKKLSEFGPNYDPEPVSKEEVRFSNRNRLYVGNLPNESSESDLKELFQPFGEIAETFVDKKKNYAFVKVDLHVNAQKAQRSLDGLEHKGRKIRVRFAPNETSVKVVNLDLCVTPDLLFRTFEIFGPVEQVGMVLDDKKVSTGEAIVEFSRKNSALSAIRFCEDHSLLLTASPKPVIVTKHEPERDAQEKVLPEPLAKKLAALESELRQKIYELETETLKEQLKERELVAKRLKMEAEAE